MMTGLQGMDIVPIELKVAAEKTRTVDMDLYNIAKIFFG